MYTQIQIIKTWRTDEIRGTGRGINIRSCNGIHAVIVSDFNDSSIGRDPNEFGRDPNDPLPYGGVHRTQNPLGINLCINFAHKLFNFP